ncbi:MAG: hypothetical protein RI930_63 [Pseudomonadota bacterium]|jgi:hypothetical protein
MADIFYKIFKNHNKDLNGIKSGSCIKFEDEFYILFYCEEMFVYNRLPSAYKEDWYFYNLQTRVIQRVHSYNKIMLKYYSNQTK